LPLPQPIKRFERMSETANPETYLDPNIGARNLARTHKNYRFNENLLSFT
jgi:hypothetical protein